MRLIDADKLKDYLMLVRTWKIVHLNITNVGYSVGDVYDAIDNRPTVDAVPVRHGHWVERDDDDCCIRCSVCNGYFALPEPVHECHPIDDMGLNYCPNCGADMRDKK